MNYLNIHTDTLKSVEFIGADPTERATWISLLGWCASQENGGVIEDCRDWPDRKWQQLCGVLKSEVETMSELYGFQGDNLVVTFYPIESESAVKAKRKAGKKGGRPKKEDAETKQPREEKPHGYPDGKPQGSSDLKRNGKKWKEMERNEKKRKEIPELCEVVEQMKIKLPELNSEWTPERVRKAATLKYETCMENGWRDGNGNAIQNWKLKFLNMLKFDKPWAYGSEDSPAKSGQRSMKTLTPDML